MSEQKILRELLDVECQLSPENLSCDGELPMGQVRRRERALLKRKAALEAQLGRKPTWDELMKVQ